MNMGRPPKKYHQKQRCTFCNSMFSSIRKHLVQSTCGDFMQRQISQHGASGNAVAGLQVVGYKVSENGTKITSSKHLTKRQSLYMQSQVSVKVNAPPHYDGNVSELSFGGNDHNISSSYTSNLHDANAKFHFESLDPDDDYEEDDQIYSEMNLDENIVDFGTTHGSNDSFLLLSGGNQEHQLEPDSSINNEIINVASDSHRLLIAPSLTSYANIYSVMNKLHIPLYGYDLILNTIRQEVSERNLDLRVQEYSRKNFLKEIQGRFSCPKPNVIKVHLDNRWNDRENAGVINKRDTVDVITFDFSEQLIDLLNDISLFGDLDNLVINRSTENPMSKWLPYNRQDPNTVFEVLDGNWYQQYARHLVKDPSTEFCVPIGLYIDASETVVYQRYSFQPLIMFPLILNCKARNRITSSRVIALIPNLDAKSSAVKNATRMGGREYKGTSIRNYHQCMEAALQSLKDCQKSGGLRTFLRLGNDVSERLLKVPVAFILGDAKSQDHLAGRYGGHNTKRMCRACNVRFDNSDRASFKCKWVQFDRFHEKSIVALNIRDQPLDQGTKRDMKDAFSFLQKHSQHALLNAFHDIDFAGFPRGIFGCTPHDLMHIFLEGVLKYSTRIFINGFLEKHKAAIDKLVEHLFGNLRSSEKKKHATHLFHQRHDKSDHDYS
jgi:hypothetical protein